MTAARALSASLQQLGGILAARDLAGLSDAELVGRFASDRDGVAFSALVRRYGGVVLGVCRRVLRHEQDAEDAFQATFLVLARNAGALRRSGAVGNWLYGVAYNVARKARAMRHRRQVKEREAAARQRPDTPATLLAELQEVLDGELHALPARYRAPIVLCDLRGLTIREAAAEVGCPPKTLGTRLSRGRSLLARRLTRRGVAVSAATLAAALAPPATAAELSRLIGPTVHAAVGLAAGPSAAVSPAVAALTHGVSRVMLPNVLKCVVVLACGGLALVGLSAGSHSSPPGQPATPVAASVVSDPGPAGRLAGTAAAAAPREVKRAHVPDLMAHLHLLHRLLVLVFAPASASRDGLAAPHEGKDDKDGPALSGTWSRKESDHKVEFCDKGVLKISAHNGALTVVCKYTTAPGGLVKARIERVEGDEGVKERVKDQLPVGLKFSFTWTGRGDTAALDDVKGDKVESFKSHLEGEYHK
jgi:RNA polymerase sigma factor (sigma-70 family)